MYDIKIESFPIVNIETRDKEVIIKNASVKLPYGAMINRSFRIDDEMMTKILDSGTPAIKVFRYIKSHTNSQNNKVILKAIDIIEYLSFNNIKATPAEVSNGIKALTNINFLIKANTLKVYNNDASNVYLVNPNYYIVSSVDTVFRRIQSDERVKYDIDRILREDNEIKERNNSVAKLKLKRNGKIESKNQETSTRS